MEPLRLFRFPIEITEEALTYVPTRTLAVFARCNRLSYKIAEPMVWGRLLQRNGGQIRICPQPIRMPDKSSLEWLDALIRMPSLQNLVTCLSWDVRTLGIYPPYVAMSTRPKLLERNNWLQNELGALVTVGMISDLESHQLEAQLKRGNDGVVWLVTYSLCSKLKCVEFLGTAKDLSFVLQKLIRYLWTPYRTETDRSRNPLTLPAPELLRFRCDMRQQKIHELSQVLFLPSLRMFDCQEIGDHDPVSSFSWPVWRYTMSRTVGGDHDGLNQPRRNFSNIRYLRMTRTPLPSNALAVMIQTMPRVQHIRFVEGRFSAARTYSVLNWPYRYQDSELGAWIHLSSFREYVRHLSTYYQRLTGRSLPESIVIEYWPSNMMESRDSPWPPDTESADEDE